MPFSVIPNGCEACQKAQTLDIRTKYRISDEDFLFVFVGNVNPNKNQKQVVDAFKLINETFRQSIKILFVGGGDWKELVEYTAVNDLSSNLIACGPVPKEEVHNFYIAANATILTSLSEGFGLSIIEGFVYGCPCLTFSDLPAVKDLFSLDSMLLCETRDTVKLAESILMMTQLDWNQEAIKEHGKQFSLGNMARKYITLYRDCLQ